MDARVCLVTLGVQDLERARRFYRDGPGWPMSSVGGDEVAFFRTGGVVLALYPRVQLAEDAGLAPGGPGFGGIALAQNVATRELVDAALADAVAAGGTLLKAAVDAPWGGYTGYFTDVDGYPWEVAWNPGFELAPDGSVVLPE